ncbi:MAG: hypothetical protein WCZ47_03995 [Bacilli bacterium]|jgi:hypothetical protein|nr:hypothetical protein [Bacilli bacterium]
MRYRKISVFFKEYPTRLNRVLLVREDVDLFTLGVVILVSMRAMFTHYFMFKNKKLDFIPEGFYHYFNPQKEDYMTNYHLLDLGNDFTLIYDTGEYYEFSVSVESQPTDIQSRKLCFFVSGKGAGIVEDDITTLTAYFAGEINGEKDDDDHETGRYMPWNIKLKKYKDYDNPLRKKTMERLLTVELAFVLNELEKNKVF